MSYHSSGRIQPPPLEPQQLNLFAKNTITPSYGSKSDALLMSADALRVLRIGDDFGQAALYCVIDSAASLLLYVGETKRSNKRWRGTHDCKHYIASYQDLHYRYQMETAVNIGFWCDAPVERRARQQLELSLILKWRSPFNKENWELWGNLLSLCEPIKLISL